MNCVLKIIFLFTIVFFFTTFNISAQSFKCGDKIRITHIATGANLHSHKINYTHPNSSGQQQITAYQGADVNDVWVIQDCNNTQIRDGDQFRLQHYMTKMYLHSHQGFPAPKNTSQQEVTGWVGKDDNDLWRVEVEGNGIWSAGKKIRLIHVNTNVALHSHNTFNSLLSERQQEVTGYSERDNNDFWTAEYANDNLNNDNNNNGNNNNGNWSNNNSEKTFAGSILRTDVFSKASFSNNGRIDFSISMKNKDRYVGSCLVYYLILADSQNNIFRTFGGDQLCVDGRQSFSSRGEREERMQYSINRDEYNKMSKAAVLFTPGGKISLDLFRGNIDNNINELLKSCPECFKNIISVGNRNNQRF